MKTLIIKSAVVLLDDSDFDRIAGRNYYLGKGYLMRDIQTKVGRIKMRLEWDIVGVPPLGLMVDHKDRNPLNNQRDNLRFCTQEQNNRNRAMFNKNGRKGVFAVNSIKNKWGAQISLNGRKVHLGCFATIDEAARAYAMAADANYGEFAYY